MVSHPSGSYGSAGKVLCQRYEYARARDGRSKDGRTERQCRIGGSDGRNLFLQFRAARNARCALEAKSAADACGNFDQLELVAGLRCIDAQARTAAFSIRNKFDKVADGRG